jgi:hypothetical protein
LIIGSRVCVFHIALLFQYLDFSESITSDVTPSYSILYTQSLIVANAA